MNTSRTSINKRKARWGLALRTVAALWSPPPKLTVSEWADKYRRLSREASAEHGRWRTSRAEYQREMMDACCGLQYEMVVILAGAQVGKTELLGNVIGYHIDIDPCPMMAVQPTLKPMGEAWSKDRLAPLLRDTPRLRRITGNPLSRDTGQTIAHKKFPGGHITVSGSNSPSSLASRPIRLLLLDEVDRYPPSAGAEGDPVNLAVKRADTFWNKLIIMTSTPHIEGMSRIKHEFLLTDQRYFFVPCPDCGHKQTLVWPQVQFSEDNPYETAEYQCSECGSLWSESQKNRAVSKGEWRATATAKGRRAGFHISALYSPWKTLGQIAGEFCEAHGERNTEKLKVWVNTCLGETWDDGGDGYDADALSERVEQYDVETLPDDILAVTCGVDVQQDRLEARTVGWGVERERWLIEKAILWGDPEKSDVWQELDEFLGETKYDVAGRKLPIACTLIDSGYHADRVYRFTKPRQGRRIFASKGAKVYYGPLVGKATQVSLNRAKLWNIGADTAKDSIVLHSLPLKEHGPNYIHFPRTMTMEDFQQLTAERKETKLVRGQRKSEWVKQRERNEEIDLQVLNLAAVDILKPNWGKIQHMRANPPKRKQTEPQQKVEVDPVKRAMHRRRVAQQKARRGKNFATDI